MTNTNKDFRKPEIKKDDNIGKAIQQYQEQKQQEAVMIARHHGYPLKVSIEKIG